MYEPMNFMYEPVFLRKCFWTLELFWGEKRNNNNNKKTLRKKQKLKITTLSSFAQENYKEKNYSTFLSQFGGWKEELN